jgi:hypothetical protein
MVDYRLLIIILFFAYEFYNQELTPCPEHPDHEYTQHIFYTNDPVPKDYYNFMLMHGKAHEVHPAERELGWAFVSRFSRNADGSLNDTKGRKRGIL